MKNIRLTQLMLITFILILTLAACSQPKSDQPSEGSAGMANPASVNCVDQGGEVSIQKRPDGGEYGICIFEDNRQCEEWAMMNGECPVGGIKITGYVTPAAVFCAITGGDYAVTDDSGGEKEQGTCTLNSGKTCDVWEYYEGTCDSGD